MTDSIFGISRTAALNDRNPHSLQLIIETHARRSCPTGPATAVPPRDAHVGARLPRVCHISDGGLGVAGHANPVAGC